MSRQERINAVGYDWLGATKSGQSECPICDRRPADADLREQLDRYGFTVRVAHCRACSHHWLSPYLDTAAARRFYADGSFRQLADAYHGVETTPDRLLEIQRQYGERLADVLDRWISDQRVLIDIGGAPGTVAELLARRFGFSDVGIVDPATDNTLAEEWNYRENDLVLMCQTVDHLLSPGHVFRCLRDNFSLRSGLLWVDILDWHLRPEVKIDHPQMFTEQSARDLFRRTGFVVIEYLPDGLTPEHRGFVLGPKMERR